MQGTMYSYNTEKKVEKKRTSLFGPIVLIGLGILLLLSNVGALNLDFWQLLFRFWPIFLIAAGLDILFGRRANGGALITLMLLLGLVFGGIWLGYVDAAPFENVQGEQFSQALEGAQRAIVTIESSMSQMKIGASDNNSALVEGAVALHHNEELSKDFVVTNGIATYTLTSDTRSFILPTFGRDADGLWELHLNRGLPLDLNVSTGVGSATLDLTTLDIADLQVHAGVGKVAITLPTQGLFAAKIQGGVGEITVLIPTTLAARIDAKAGLGSVRVEGDFEQNGSVYASANYESSINRVDLVVEGGIGALTVRQVTKE